MIDHLFSYRDLFSATYLDAEEGLELALRCIGFTSITGLTVEDFLTTWIQERVDMNSGYSDVGFADYFKVQEFLYHTITEIKKYSPNLYGITSTLDISSIKLEETYLKLYH